jgi:hypothetical protein
MKVYPGFSKGQKIASEENITMAKETDFCFCSSHYAILRSVAEDT